MGWVIEENKKVLPLPIMHTSRDQRASTVIAVRSFVPRGDGRFTSMYMSTSFKDPLLSASLPCPFSAHTGRGREALLLMTNKQEWTMSGSKRRIFSAPDCVLAVQCRSGSSKVDDFGTNRKRVYDFLLVGHCDYGPILHRF